METAKGREIKFRFWVEKAQRMSDWGTAKKECDRLSLLSLDGFIPMQFIGLLDKNGVEIYEADLLINPEGKVGIVVWYEGGFYLQCDRKSGQPFFVALTNGFVANKLQIGNLYTNPELLTPNN